MSHSNERSSSHASTSIAISSKDSATWYGKPRLILKITLIPYENITGTRVKPLGLVGFNFGPTKSDVDGMKAPRAGPKWSTRLLTKGSAGRRWVRNRSRTPAADAGLTGWAVPGTCPERAP